MGAQAPVLLPWALLSSQPIPQPQNPTCNPQPDPERQSHASGDGSCPRPTHGISCDSAQRLWDICGLCRGRWQQTQGLCLAQPAGSCPGTQYLRLQKSLLSSRILPQTARQRQSLVPLTFTAPATSFIFSHRPSRDQAPVPAGRHRTGSPGMVNATKCWSQHSR